MADKKESALRCVLVLTVIAVICGVLLAVLNPLLYVAPTADDVSKHFSIEGVNREDWQVVELNTDYAGKTSDKSGAAVNLFAKAEHEGETYYGMLVTTKASGNLSECKFVMFFTASDNKLIEAKITVDGSSGGKYTYESALNRSESVKGFEKYYVAIESENQFDDGYSIPKVGATLTLTAVDNAFKKACYYYYNVIVKGA